MSRRCCLASMEVLDTAALLSWPLEMLMQGICANSQLNEVQRLSPSRHLMLEAQGPRFETPNPAAITVATEASQETGTSAAFHRSIWTFWLSHSLQATPWLRMIIACRTSVHTEGILGEASFKRGFGKFVLMPWNVSAADPFTCKVRCAPTAGHHWH